MYTNDTQRRQSRRGSGGDGEAAGAPAVSRPNELERQVDDRLSFQRFLGYPERAPDYSTVWRLRDHLV